MAEQIPLYISPLKSILVIGGGGIRGLCALGAITKLEELRIINKPEILCGTSCGAMIAILMLIGYSSVDIYNLLLELNFATLVEINIDCILDDPLIGLSSNEKFANVLKKMMQKKGINTNITFSELYDKIPRQLIITGTCLNDCSIHYFSAKNTPNMSVMTAIQISMNVPILFKPIHYDGCLWIDGGCINNYPIDLFQNDLHDCVGINFSGADKQNAKNKTFEDPQSYIGQIMACLIRGANLNKAKHYKKVTVNIICENGNAFDWTIPYEDKVKLYESGKTTVDECAEKLMKDCG